MVLTTAGSEAQAVALARELVERGVAACVNILAGACSIFRWKGEIVEEDEKILLIKIRAERFEEVRATIRELHSYEVPEIIALPIEEGDRDYLDWLSENA